MAPHASVFTTKENDLTHSSGMEANLPAGVNTFPYSRPRVLWREGFGNGLGNGQTYSLNAKERETGGQSGFPRELSESRGSASNASLEWC